MGERQRTTTRQSAQESQDWPCARRRETAEADRSQEIQEWPSRNNSSKEAPQRPARTTPSVRNSGLRDTAGKQASVPRPGKMKTRTTKRGGRNENRRATKRRATPPPARCPGHPVARRRVPPEIARQGKGGSTGPAEIPMCRPSIVARNEAESRRAADGRFDRCQTR